MLAKGCCSNPRHGHREEYKNEMKKIIALVLLIFVLALSGCGNTSLNLPQARDLCLSEIYDLYNLNYWLDEDPIPHDEFSQEYDPYAKYASYDYETRYYRVFYTRYPIEIHKTCLRLAPGFSLENDVRVYKSEEKAREGFADMEAPRFAFSEENILGTTGTEWDIAQVGEESKAWYFAQKVLDKNNEVMVTQYEVEMYFRKGSVISSIGITVWGNDSTEVKSFLLDVAQLSENKISKSIDRGY